MHPISSIIQYPQTPSPGLNNPPAHFSIANCFWWLHDKNIEFNTNIRGKVNHEYNHLLKEKGLLLDLVPGGEDLEELGMDKKTLIIRPNLYLDACHRVISVHTNDPFSGLNLSTATFFDLLHWQNVKYSANIRGFVNQRYNELLFEAGIHDGKIPGDDDLEQLGMDKSTPINAVFYAKAYGQVIAEFEPTWQYSDRGPFNCSNIFTHFFQFMERSDIPRCSQVCKLWKKFSDAPGVWQQFFTKEKIPLVQNSLNCKADFKALLPITFSGRMIEQLLGEVIGEIPNISSECFDKLGKKDPFCSWEHTMDKNFIFMVVPYAIKRVSGEKFPCTLNANGDLVVKSPENIIKEELIIPFSLNNLVVLCSYPLKGKEYLPVFGKKFANAWTDHYKPCSDKITVSFMRRATYYRSARVRDLDWKERDLDFLKFNEVSLIHRALFSAMEILSSGRTEDIKSSYWCSFARTINFSKKNDQLFIGNFQRGIGLDVLTASEMQAKYEMGGLVPECAAEANLQPPTKNLNFWG